MGIDGWIGSGGTVGGQALQAGCDSDVMISGGNVSRQLNLWWAWYADGPYEITNLAVAQGDTLNCMICATNESKTRAEVILYNVTSNTVAGFLATAPTGEFLFGNSAEWVVERITIDGNPAELASYGDVYFDEANAGTVNDVTLNAGSGIAINMVDGDQVISQSTIETATLVQVQYTGPEFVRSA